MRVTEMGLESHQSGDRYLVTDESQLAGREFKQSQVENETNRLIQGQDLSGTDRATTTVEALDRDSPQLVTPSETQSVEPAALNTQFDMTS
jgi:hypothetical protein